MSNRLLTLVWGAEPFGNARIGPTLRLVLASLADQVNEKQHVEWCFPRLEEIQERTELGRRTVLRALATLRKAKWLRVELRPGYGSAYFFDIPKLEAAQRPKPYRCLQDTRAFTAPVPLTTDRGALNDVEGCLERLTNIEEPEVNQKEPEPSLSLRDEPVLSSPVSGQKKPAKAKAPKAEKREPDPRHTPFKAILAEYWRVSKNRIEMPWGGAAAGALGTLLSENPHLDEKEFRNMLRNRIQSEAVNHAEHPKLWLVNVVKYANEPLTKHQQPKGEANGTHRKNPGTSYETRTDRLKSDAAGAYSDVLARITPARPTGTAGPLV